jgi:adenylate cyclase
MSSTSPGSTDPGRRAAMGAARYHLVGRMTETGDQLRIIVGLVDAATEQHLWGDSYDGANSELFALQDRVTEGVVRAVLPNIRNSEIARARRRRPEDLNAYELTMRALPLVLASSPEAALRALDLLERAIELDPDYGLATAMAAWGHAQLVLHNGAPDASIERARALLLAERAGILEPDDSMVLTARSAVYTMAGEFEGATALAARALALDPTFGWAWERSAWLKTYMGQPDVAIEHFGRAMQFDPCSASNGNRFVGFGSAHFDAGRYDAGAFWMRKAVLEYPGTAWVNRTLAVSYARLGDRLTALDSLTALRRFSPHVTIGQIVSAIPFRRDFLDRVSNGLDDLGLPP